ncbi:BTAD domain-containing putative transcriptional regulator [Streptomyces sp. NPDC059989]|uniref:BTAD domain-containing putative transcriptional regulator n=1 Tax=Streptomyces sp. NPDC059989 TaxID=3347026 RepID=UPI0036910749
MEVLDQGKAVGLGGTKQRATLGFLLLQANKVVATSQLMNALWGVDDAPTTARKILQNAVYGLRGSLFLGQAERDPGAAALLTQPPGYMMRVDPDQVDLYLFQKWVSQGREQLAGGAPESASSLLSDALALWRGPALADLVEAGIQWPELAAVENTRLEVMEDYFDAQLACGRHHSVLVELETMVQAEPLRERSCGQLMLALYRYGRQADALNVYSRVRSVLVESLGLEPGHALQQLQQAILIQDPALTLAESGTRGPIVVAAEAPPAAQERRSFGGPVGSSQGGGSTVPEQRTGSAVPEQRAASERRRVSVVSVRTRLAPSLVGGAAQDLDALLEGAGQLVREQVERFGGTVMATIGSVSLALFGLDEPGDDDARRAVLAALAIRDVLDVSAGSGPEAAQLTVQCAVTNGEVLLRRRGPEDAPTVVGTVLDESQALLSEVPAGAVRVSDAVRRASEDAVLYWLSDPASAGWQALGGRDEEHTEAGGTEAYELDILRGLVKRGQHRGVPHLVTVLGEAGTGKSRLLRDFERWVTVRAGGSRVLTARVPTPAEGVCFLVAPAQILEAYCGIRAGDDEATAQAALTRAVRSLFQSERTSELLISRLRPLVAKGDTGLDIHYGEMCPTEVLDAWGQLLQEAARQEPLVLCIDDLHRADDVVLDAVEELAETAGSGPLLVVAGAGPELLLRRPSWSGGKSHATTVTLGRPERVSNEQLVELLLSATRSEGTESFTG